MGLERVWCKFSVTKSDGSTIKLRIQDMPSDRLDDAVDLNICYFTPEETFHRAAGIPKNPDALIECREFVSEMFKDSTVHIVICCSDDYEFVGQIIGVSIVTLSTTDDGELDDLEFKTDEVKKYFELLEGYFSLYDVMQNQNLTKCFDDRGIVVHPDYRGLGIATKLLKIRREMCKHYGVPATCAWMTSYGSQKAAQNDGWEILFEFSYEEFGAKHGVTFTDVPPTCKLMLARQN